MDVVGSSMPLPLTKCFGASLKTRDWNPRMHSQHLGSRPVTCLCLFPLPVTQVRYGILRASTLGESPSDMFMSVSFPVTQVVREF